MDVLFINPAESKRIYQDLSEEYSAIEASTWALLLAQSCRSTGYSVGILDVLAEIIADIFTCIFILIIVHQFCSVFPEPLMIHLLNFAD